MNLHADDVIYNNLLSIVAEYLNKGYGIVYAAENDPSYKIINDLAKGTKSTTIGEACEKKRALMVIDYNSPYYSSKRNDTGEEHASNNSNNSNPLITTSTLIKRWQSEIQNKRNNKYNKILIAGTCKAFSDRQDYDGLIAYEDAINHQLLSASSFHHQTSSTESITSTSSITNSNNTIIEHICCYRTSGIERISSLSTMASVLTRHNNCIASTEKTVKKNDREDDDDSSIKAIFFAQNIQYHHHHYHQQ